MFFLAVLQAALFASLQSVASEPDWSSSATIPITGRANPYHWDEKTLQDKIRRGRAHATHYPVEVTGLLLPARPALRIFDLEPGDRRFGLMKMILSIKGNFKNFKGFWDWLGLSNYPDEDWANDLKSEYPMGVTKIHRNGVDGFTLSCATCHASTLFGKPVLGLTTRFPRANDFFVEGKSAMKIMSPTLFGLVSGANREEKEMFRDARETIRSIGVKSPTAYGLDTSLAQVALSLSLRKQNEWADLDPTTAANPRPNLLDHFAADSKPAVWWNLKYKTRWGSDGATVSGNPVYMVFLWNELGRGTDLRVLTEWLEKNSSVVEELTTAVFATEAPKWRNLIGESSLKIERAKRGADIFAVSCAGCHGQYEKNWERSPDTVAVKYFEKTPIKNVGTDLNRAKGMAAFADTMNGLAYSKRFGIVTTVQGGYIPPPLEGIWARYPYFHNNSIPNLCALLTAPEQRPTTYWAGKPEVPGRDFDLDCVGYPLGDSAPAAWKGDKRNRFDVGLPGLSNQGHYEGILRKNGKELYTAEQKQDLIEFLKTL